jgi:sugar/nucleoside kinase (ribokinase family)
MLATTEADLTGIRTVAGATTSYSVVFDPPEADRSFWHHLGTNTSFDGTRIDLSDTDLAHLGYPTALPRWYSDRGERLFDLLGQARGKRVTTSVDMSTIDPGSEAATTDWPALLARTLPRVDVFTPSVDDLTAALGPVAEGPGPTAPELARLAVDLGAAVVLLTDGPRGMYLFTGGADRLADAGRCFVGRADWADQELFVPADAVPVARTTGAGDAAAAGLIYGILTDAGPKTALRCAAAAAAAVVRGGSLTRSTLDENVS